MPPDDAGFDSTHWSALLPALRERDRTDERSRRAAEHLCRAYYAPIKAYAARRLRDERLAEDRTQAFFLSLLEGSPLSGAGPERGRFRAYLVASFRNYLAKQAERERAQKRGGPRGVASLDAAEYDPSSSERTPDREFDRQWAIALLEQTTQRLRNEWTTIGKGDVFEALLPHLSGDSETDYAAAAERLRTTSAAARMTVSRMRRRFRTLLRDEAGRTVSSSDEVDDEIRELFAALGDERLRH